MTDFAAQTMHKARKPHRCFWCGELINAGEHFIRHCQFEPGEPPAPMRFHSECDVSMHCLDGTWGCYEGFEEQGHHRGCTCTKDEPCEKHKGRV